MRVQLKKKRGKVHRANFISAKRLPNAAWGWRGAVSPPADRGLSPGGAEGARPPENFAYFPLKMP